LKNEKRRKGEGVKLRRGEEEMGVKSFLTGISLFMVDFS
jgi:hypothetical protein